ncbi:MAG TPA: OmpH family outer membrane protein [Edaphocola sp.]|nr:OmpH family outer membrane protein [Edaphocola sp.]
MKKQISFLVLLLCLSTIIVKAQGIGTVSRVAIFKSLPNFIKDLRQIDSLEKRQNVEIEFERQLLQEQGRGIVNKYNPKEEERMETIKKRMTPEDTMSLKKLLDKGDLLEKKKEAYDKKLADMQKLNIDPMLKKIELSIKAIAVEENLDAIFYIEDINNLAAYLNEKKDFTAKVIAFLKK